MIDRQLAQCTRCSTTCSTSRRVVSGKIELARRAVDLAQVVKLALEAVEPLVAGREPTSHDRTAGRRDRFGPGRFNASHPGHRKPAAQRLEIHGGGRQDRLTVDAAEETTQIRSETGRRNRPGIAPAHIRSVHASAAQPRSRARRPGTRPHLGTQSRGDARRTGQRLERRCRPRQRNSSSRCLA